MLLLYDTDRSRSSAIIGAQDDPTRKGRLMAKKATAAQKRQRAMSDDHKAALAEGREQGRVVRRYLEALESYRPKRGRRRTPESITKRLAAIDEQLAGADPLSRLHLTQERMDREQELTATGRDGGEMEALEAAFMRLQPPTASEKG